MSAFFDGNYYWFLSKKYNVCRVKGSWLICDNLENSIEYKLLIRLGSLVIRIAMRPTLFCIHTTSSLLMVIMCVNIYPNTLHLWGGYHKSTQASPHLTTLAPPYSCIKFKIALIIYTVVHLDQPRSLCQHLKFQASLTYTSSENLLQKSQQWFTFNLLVN